MIERNETIFAQQQVVRLQALLEAGRRIHSTIALEVVLNTVLEIVVRELELDGAFFTHFPNFYGDVDPTLLRTHREHGIRSATEDGVYTLPSALSGTVSAEVLMRFPLRDKTGVMFTELVVIQPADRTLTFDELDFLESLALQSAVAIENARFHERTVQWQRLESDLASARQVQRSLLPQHMPHIPGYSLAARSVTCYAVGGDYLDIVPMACGKTTIVVADVAGKGLASALVSVSFRSAFRAMVNSGIPLLEIATRMNLLHHQEGEESRRRYVTAIFLQLDPISDTIQVVNAGHNPAFLTSAAKSDDASVEFQKIGASGTPIGLLPFSTYEVETYPVPCGARLLLYTDGLTEVFCGDEEFGEDRLLESFQHACSPHPEKVLDSLWTKLDAFSDGREQCCCTAE
jgi:serine phosphatase RsbU (regulator of sigma subunit)